MNLEAVYFGNALAAWINSGITFVAVVIVLRMFLSLIIGRLSRLAEKSSVRFDVFLIGLIRTHATVFLYFVVGLYLASRSLYLPEAVQRIIEILFIFGLTFKLILVLQDVLSYLINAWMNLGKPNPSQAAIVKNIQILVRVALWTVAVLFMLNNMGVNVTAFVAGLGVGGVAVALAAQAILGDAFSSFAIYMDKPFEVGDFIIVGDMLGVVEHVGFKTTRIRSLGGEQLIFSNSDLTSSRIRNYKRMRERRIVFEFGVIYQTTAQQVKEIPSVVRSIVESVADTRFDRAHFKEFGDFALTFEVVYHVLSPDYNIYMDKQQEINVKLMEAFEKAKISFAYPTQQLYVTKVGEVNAR